MKVGLGEGREKGEKQSGRKRRGREETATACKF